MSIYGELNLIAEPRIPEAFVGTREHMVKFNKPNMAYPSRRHEHRHRNTLKITFNLQIESTDKTRRVINNVGRALFKKKGAHSCFNRY